MSVFFCISSYFLHKNLEKYRLFDQVWKRLLVDGLDFSGFWVNEQNDLSIAKLDISSNNIDFS